ncbi:hypothetical protein HDU80_003546, partial [Chytriomyces hyalinus]
AMFEAAGGMDRYKSYLVVPDAIDEDAMHVTPGSYPWPTARTRYASELGNAEKQCAFRAEFA